MRRLRKGRRCRRMESPGSYLPADDGLDPELRAARDALRGLFGKGREPEEQEVGFMFVLAVYRHKGDERTYAMFGEVLDESEVGLTVASSYCDGVPSHTTVFKFTEFDLLAAYDLSPSEEGQDLYLYVGEEEVDLDGYLLGAYEEDEDEED
jgi:hypothetical protein